MRGDGLVEEHDELARQAVFERGNEVERDLDADDRCARKDLPTRFAQARKPPADDRLHPFGHAQRLADGVGRPAQASFVGEQPDDLAHKQRVPLGLAMDGLSQAIGRSLTRGKLDVARHLVDGESRRIEPLPRRNASDLGEEADPWVRWGQLALPIGGQHHDASLRQVHGHEPEQQQGRLVGGVKIVEDQDDRTIAGGVPQQSRDRIEEFETGTIGFVVGQVGQLRKNVADFRKHLRQVRPVGSDEPAKVVGLEIPQEGAHRLEPGPVDRRPACLPASAPGHPGTVLSRFDSERVREARLADAGFARQQDQATAAA